MFGLATIVFGLSTNLYLSLACLFVLGAADMVSVYVRQTLVQLETPDAMRGRVAAVNAVFIGASNELGEFESGVLAALVGAGRGRRAGRPGHARRRGPVGALVPGIAGPRPADRVSSAPPRAPRYGSIAQSGRVTAAVPGIATGVGLFAERALCACHVRVFPKQEPSTPWPRPSGTSSSRIPPMPPRSWHPSGRR